MVLIDLAEKCNNDTFMRALLTPELHRKLFLRMLGGKGGSWRCSKEHVPIEMPKLKRVSGGQELPLSADGLMDMEGTRRAAS